VGAARALEPLQERGVGERAHRRDQKVCSAREAVLAELRHRGVARALHRELGHVGELFVPVNDLHLPRRELVRPRLDVLHVLAAHQDGEPDAIRLVAQGARDVAPDPAHADQQDVPHLRSFGYRTGRL
jgi:hypothetical protein